MYPPVKQEVPVLHSLISVYLETVARAVFILDSPVEIFVLPPSAGSVHS